MSMTPLVDFIIGKNYDFKRKRYHKEPSKLYLGHEDYQKLQDEVCGQMFTVVTYDAYCGKEHFMGLEIKKVKKKRYVRVA